MYIFLFVSVYVVCMCMCVLCVVCCVLCVVCCVLCVVCCVLLCVFVFVFTRECVGLSMCVCSSDTNTLTNCSLRPSRGPLYTRL